MPFVPDLIPEDKRVLPEYFDPSRIEKTATGPKTPVMNTVLAVLLFGAGAWSYQHPGILVLLFFAGLICTGKGGRFVEKAGRFSLTNPVRAILFALLLVIYIPLYFYYDGQDQAQLAYARQKAKNAARYSADSLKADMLRKDSLQLYAGLAAKTAWPRNFAQLNQMRRFVLTDDDRFQFRKLREKLDLAAFGVLYKQGDYQMALDTLTSALQVDSSNHQVLFYRALCYLKLRRVQLAVYDLYKAMNSGDKAAAGLYAKVNPARRHVVGHETLCGDGTTSDAAGSGACSHHGGVAEWNHPIYEISRKYANTRDSI